MVKRFGAWELLKRTRLSKRWLRKPSLDFRVNYRGNFAGYAYLRHKGNYRVTLNLNAMLEDVATGCHGHPLSREWHKTADAINRFILFIQYFWDIYHHELIGHGVGHKLKIRGHSRGNDGHLRWLEENLTNAQMELWAESERTDVVSIFSDVAKWFQDRFPVKDAAHTPSALENFQLLCASHDLSSLEWLFESSQCVVKSSERLAESSQNL